jgi:hypothetical protein
MTLVHIARFHAFTAPPLPAGCRADPSQYYVHRGATVLELIRAAPQMGTVDTVVF